MALRWHVVRLGLLAAACVAGCGGGGGTEHAATTQAGHSRPAHHAPAPRRVAALTPPAGAPARSVRVPVLTYHRVNPLRPGANTIETDLTIEPGTFATEMRDLAAGGYHSVTQAQLFDALYRGKALPPHPVLISVDDGYVDDVRHILPVLRANHLVATFFVITGRFHMPGFVDPAQVRKLDRAGMDVGDHTAHHVDLTLLTPAELRSEVAGSRRVLQRTLGHPVYFFAYPFGRQNPTVVDAVRRAGFTMAYTTAYGVAESTTAPLLMPRLHIGRSVTPSALTSLLGG